MGYVYEGRFINPETNKVSFEFEKAFEKAGLSVSSSVNVEHLPADGTDPAITLTSKQLVISDPENKEKSPLRLEFYSRIALADGFMQTGEVIQGEIFEGDKRTHLLDIKNSPSASSANFGAIATVSDNRAQKLAEDMQGKPYDKTAEVAQTIISHFRPSAP